MAFEDDSKMQETVYRENVADRLKEFASSFVSHVECILLACNSKIRGQTDHTVKKLSNAVQNNAPKIGKNTITVLSHICTSVPGIASAAGTLGEKAGELYNDKHCLEEIRKLKCMGLIDSCVKDAPKLRQDLVNAAVDIFQSFELQFMSILTDSDGLGPEKAMQLLAEDAADRCINYFKTNKYCPDLLVTSVLTGKSVKEWGIPFEKPGYLVKSNFNTYEEEWTSAFLYNKVGVLIREYTTNDIKYYTKKENGKPEKYGFRVFLSSEKLDNIKNNYNSCSCADKRYVEHRYALTPEIVEEKKKNILDEINKKDPNLMEKRILDSISNSLQNLKIKESHEVQRKKSVWFEVNEPVHLFTGRTDDFETLHALIQRSDNNESNENRVSSKMFVICGLGGIGKTEFVKMYAKKYWNYFDNNAIWINADKKENMIKSFWRLAEDELGIDTYRGKKRRSYLSIVGDVYRCFGKEKSLFIFDNAEKNHINEFLPRSLPPEHNTPFILITSRTEKWGTQYQVKRLENLELNDAILLVRKGLRITEGTDNGNIKELVNKLHKFPLVLTQAIACMNEKESDITHFLQEYESNPHIFLKSKAFKGDNIDYENTFLTTWEITKGKIKSEGDAGELAVDSLNTIAYFASENIHKNILLSFTQDTEAMEGAIRLLVRYFVLNEQSNPHIFSIHSLVQETTRLNLKHNKNENSKEDCKSDCKENCAKHSKEERERLRKVLEFIDSHLGPGYLDHAMSAWNHASAYTILVKAFKSLLRRILDQMSIHARYAEAVSFGTKAIKSLKQELGDDNIDTLKTENCIADVLYKQGEYNDALKRYKVVFSRMKNTLTINDPNTLNTMLKIVVVLNAKGDYYEALEMCDTLISKKEYSLVPDRLFALHERAKILDNLGRYKGAIESFRKVLKGRKGNNDSSVHILQELGITLANQGEHKEALQTLNTVLEERKRLLGMDNAKTLETMNEIAIVLNEQGMYDLAIREFIDVLERRSIVLDENHQSTLVTLHELAKVLRNKGLYNESSHYFQKVIKKRVEILGQDHPATVLSRHENAILLSCQGKYREAVTKLTQIYIVRYEKLGKNHPSTLATLHEIGRTLMLLSEKEYAHEFLEETYKDKIKVLNENHPSTLATKNCFGEVMLKHGKSEAALKIFEDVYFKRKQQLGEGHPNSLETRNCIGEVKLNQSNFQEAWEIFQEVYERRNNKLGETHPSSLTSRSFMGEVKLKEGNLEEAKNIFKEVYEKRKDVLGVEHPCTLATRCCLQGMQLQHEKCENSSNVLLDIDEKDSRKVSSSTTHEAAENGHNPCDKDSDMRMIQNFKKNVRIICVNHLDYLAIYQCTSKVLLQQGKIDKALKVVNSYIESSNNLVRDILALQPQDNPSEMLT